LKFEFSRPLPQGTLGDFSYETSLYGALRTDRKQPVRWKSEFPFPSEWPLVIGLPNTRPEMHTFTTLQVRMGHWQIDPNTGIESVISEMPVELLEGDSELRAMLSVDVIPLEVNAQPAGTRASLGRFGFWRVGWQVPGYRWYGNVLLPNERFESRSQDLFVASPESRPAVRVPLKRGHATRLRIEVPDDLEARIERLSEIATDSTTFLNAVRTNNPFVREAKITILGTEPLDEREEASDEGEAAPAR
jgi:hypothetical protein